MLFDDKKYPGKLMLDTREFKQINCSVITKQQQTKRLEYSRYFERSNRSSSSSKAVFGRRTSTGSGHFASLGIGLTNFRPNRHHTADSNVSLEHFQATYVTV